MIIVTGAVGFVGHNLVKLLNDKGHKDIVLIDSLSTKNYFKNLIGLEYLDFLNFEQGLDYLKNSLIQYQNIEVIFHIGANADVLIEDCNIMMNMNFEHSKFWFELSKKQNIPFIYASSSAVYGNSNSFKIKLEDEVPHNEYAFSKLAFDNYVRGHIGSCENKVIGYRFFNIFGIGEFHKDKNASLPHRFFEFVVNKGYIDLFNREISRDYVWVEDVCNILYHTWKLNVDSGIYNLGSGNPISHDRLANLVVDTMIEEKIIDNSREKYVTIVPMPENLVDKFQYYTCAENLLDWIAVNTKNNETKIKSYIKELCRKYKNENTK